MTAWPSVRFLDAVEDVSRGNTKIPQREYLEFGRLPVVDQGAKFIGGYVDDETVAIKSELPVIVFGDHTRALKFVDFPFAIGADGVKLLKVRPGWDARFVYHCLQYLDIPSAGYSRHFKFLKECDVPAVPIEEQRRIAAILDQADALRDKRRAALDRLTELESSIFYDMFRDGLNDISASVALGDVVSDLQGGKSLVADDPKAKTQRRVLRISAVTSYSFRPSESKPIPDTYVPDERHFVKRGDLLISRANTSELVGALAYVWDELDAPLLLPDKLWRFVWRDPAGVDPLYVWGLFKAASVRRELSARSSGTGGSMKNISKMKLLDMPVHWPSVQSQREYGDAVRSIRSLAAVHRTNLQRLDVLLEGLRARAFSGRR